ncbi:MAG: V-type ATP synthase subunit D [Candidatus Omnitrophica bacterium]|nr:V-type ATP synthase subunit D [Candidatus Omnitrophota bacterium]
MAKLRLTKNELKKQKDELKRYNQFLPTLLLKKQQLQGELYKLHKGIEKIKQEKAYVKATVYKWADVFTEKTDLEDLVHLKKLEISRGNVAGIDIPVFENAVFEEKEYDLISTPLWVDYGIGKTKDVIEMNAKTEVLWEQEKLLSEELRVTTQRVNLFEKVMIPRAKENIRKIRICLGDIQTAAVVTGKIAKEKILRVEINAKNLEVRG